MRKLKRVLSFVMALMLFALAFTGCAASGTTASSGEISSSTTVSTSASASTTNSSTSGTTGDYVPLKNSYYIYCTYKLVHAWYETIKVGVDAAVAEYAAKGITVKYDWEAPITPSGEDQTKRIESGIAKKPDVIAVSVSNPELVIAPVNEAEAAGVPVILFADADVPDCNRHAFVGNDQNIPDSEALATAICEAMGGEGELAILSGTIGAANHELRLTGFDNVLKKYPKITVVDSQRDEDLVEKATTITESLIQKYPNLKAILCNNMSNPVGAAIAVSDAGKSGKILIGAYDHDRRTLEYLKNGTIYCSMLQNCYDMGYNMVKTAIKIADGLEPGPNTYDEVMNVGSMLIYQQDAQKYIDLLYGK